MGWRALEQRMGVRGPFRGEGARSRAAWQRRREPSWCRWKRACLECATGAGRKAAERRCAEAGVLGLKEGMTSFYKYDAGTVYRRNGPVSGLANFGRRERSLGSARAFVRSIGGGI